MPHIEAYNLKPKDYLKAAKETDKDPLTRQNVMDEHGESISLTRLEAFAGRAPNHGGYVIVRRSTSKAGVKDVLEHEMRHIFKLMRREAAFANRAK